MTTITRCYHFESAHWLPGVPPEHKCSRKHGHNYLVEITASGSIDPKTGFIVDFWDLDKIVQPLIDLIDHRMLNDITGLENPTAEYIANWFLNRLASEHRPFDITKVRVYETKDCWADVSSI